MSMRKRAWVIVKAKADKALGRMEDPQETLDHSYKRQLEMLTHVECGVADVAASRKRVESQMGSLRQEQAELARQAGQAAGTDGERQALGRKTTIDRQLSDLAAHHEALRADEKRLTAAHAQLKAKVDAFRVQKEIIKATYTAAEAQNRAGEVWSSISKETDAGPPANSYERQREQLTQLWRSIKEVAAARKHLDQQTNILHQQRAELEDQARQALDAGQADLAKQAFAQKDKLDSQLPDIASTLHSLQADEDKFTTAYHELTAKLKTLRLKTETTEVDKTAGDAPPQIGEAAAGMSKNTGAVGTEISDSPSEIED